MNTPLMNRSLKIRIGLVALPLVCSALFATVFPSFAQAQQTFTLSAEEERIQSKATLDGDRLVIVDDQGNISEYRRDARSDPAGGQWKAYFSQTASQFILWPASNRGNFHIGDIDRSGGIQYRQSRMVILSQPSQESAFGSRHDIFSRLSRRRPLENQNQDNQSVVRLVAMDGSGVQRVLSERAGQFVGLPADAAQPADWRIAHHGQGFFELQTFKGSQVLALGVNSTRSLVVEPALSGIHQLWRAIDFGGASGYLLESVHFPGYCLALSQRSILVLDPIGVGSLQLWMPFAVPAAIWPQPVLRSVSTQVIPEAPLPPARLELVNTHRLALRVLLADRRPGGAVTEVKIAPNSSETVWIDRDAGSRMIENREIRLGTGEWIQETAEFQIPPECFYDLSIYEEFLQSIAIDRTGKSPSPIEDVNFMPRSVGFLLIPPGESVAETDRWDLYPMAVAADNPGAVRRYDPKAFDRTSPDPLERILDSLK
jgi:hypothetical protein